MRNLILMLGAVTIGVLAATPAPAAANGLKDIYRRAAPGVVLILATDGDGMVAKGTGSIITPEGLVLTNAHVIHNDEAGRPFKKVSVFLKPDRMTGDVKMDLTRHHNARVKAFDRTLDLAVLEIEDAPASLAAIRLADPDEVSVGESVLAIGHPETAGLWTLTTGVISAVMKDMGGVQGKDAFQTETSLNRGNSGGPLLDGQGRLVGVNTAVSRLATDGFPITGISFAIKSSVAKAWLAGQGITMAYAGPPAPEAAPSPPTAPATPPHAAEVPPAATPTPPPIQAAPPPTAQPLPTPTPPPVAAQPAQPPAQPAPPVETSPRAKKPPAKARPRPPQIYTESRPYKLTGLDRLVEQKMGELEEELQKFRSRSEEPAETEQPKATPEAAPPAAGRPTPGSSSLDTISLITEDDLAKQQAAAKKGLQEVAKSSFQELTTGPVIVVISPSQAVPGDKAVEVEIQFNKPSDGADINMDSLKVKYLKFITIDITGRLKPYVVGRKIEAKNVKFPKGSHSVGMYIEDAKGRPSAKLITVTVE